jgi:hypothetical protein
LPADGSLWLAGSYICTSTCSGLSRLDPRTGKVEAVSGVPDGGLGVAASADAVFVLSDRPDGSPYHVTRVDLPSSAVRYTVDVPGTHVTGNTNPIGRIAYGFGSVWVYEGNEVVARLDAETGAQVARVELPANTGSNGLAVNGQGVWSVAFGDTDVWRIDPATNTAALAANFVPGFAQSIAADDRSVWTTHFTTSLDLVRIDASDPSPVESTHLPTGDVAAGDGQVWFLGWVPVDKAVSAENHPGRVGRVDPETFAVTAVTELPVGTVDEAELAVGDGAAWVVDSSTHRAWRIDAN